VDVSDRKDAKVVYEGVRERVSYEAAVFLQELLKADGDWVSSTTVASLLDANEFKPRRHVERLPPNVRKHIEIKAATGSRLKVRTWRSSATNCL
jgi:hypothetical protein